MVRSCSLSIFVTLGLQKDVTYFQVPCRKSVKIGRSFLEQILTSRRSHVAAKNLESFFKCPLFSFFSSWNVFGELFHAFCISDKKLVEYKWTKCIFVYSPILRLLYIIRIFPRRFEVMSN